MDRLRSWLARLNALLIVTGCLAGAAMSAYQLHLDLNSAGVEGAGPSMAKLERREARVRRKAPSSYVWKNAEQSASLYKGESIQTGEGSLAVIRLNDGLMLELGENSLVVIDDANQLSTNLLEGSILLKDAGGEKAISKDKSGKIQVEELSVSLVSPANLAELMVPENAKLPVKLAWEFRGKAVEKGLMIQLSQDRRFRAEKTVEIALPEAGATEVGRELGSGAYFWRISKDGQPVSAVRAFKVATALPLRPSWPVAGESIRILSERPEIQFRWLPPRAVDGADDDATMDASSFVFPRGSKHRIEISGQPDFTKAIVSQQINPASGLVAVPGLPFGRMFWRLRSQYGEIDVVSRAEPFSFALAEKISLALSKPDPSAAISMGPEVRFVWASDAPDAEYAWEIVDATTKKPVVTTAVRALATVWKNPPAGSYRWRVLAKWKGKTLAESEWRALSVFAGKALGLNSPAQNQEMRSYGAPPAFRFAWDADASAAQNRQKYVLELSATPEFKGQVVSVPTDRPEVLSQSVKLFDGRQYWRVRLVDEKGQTVRSSTVWSFSWGVFPLLPAPTLARANVGEKFNPVLDKGKVSLAWDAVPGAKSYEVVLTRGSLGREPAEAKPVFQKALTVFAVDLPNLPEGEYQWTVRAVDSAGRKGTQVPARKLTIDFGAPLAPPEVLTPEVH